MSVLVRFSLADGSVIWVRADAIMSILEGLKGQTTVRLSDGTAVTVEVTAATIIERMNLKERWDGEAAYVRGDE